MAPHAKPRAPVPESAKPPGWRTPLIAIIGSAAAFLLWQQPWRSPEEPAAESTQRQERATESAPEPGTTPSTSDTVAPKVEGSADPDFVDRLLAADVRSEFSGVDLDAATIDQLSAGQIAEAALALEQSAVNGDATANVVLSILQECSGILSEVLQTLQVDQWRAAARDLPAERRARIELALHARRAAAETAAKSCREARFDRTLIAERLRAAGAAGHEASLRRQGEETTDVAARVKLWTSAAMLGHLPAQLDLAQHYRREFVSSQRGGRPMRFWMDVAAKTSSAGKLLLADCHLNGCNNAPPDVARGTRLLREAAAAGELEALERLVADRDNPELTLEERVAWSDFRDRLNESGCYGAAEYPRVSVTSWRTRDDNRAVSPYLQEQERALADRYWSQHGPTARRALSCD